MATITYPDGSQLTSTALTPNQIQTAFQIITAQMLGILTSPWLFSVTAIESEFILTAVSTVNIYQGLLVQSSGIFPEGTTITGVDGDQVSFSDACLVTPRSEVQLSVTDPQFPYKVRIGWQIEGQPGPPIQDDTVTLVCKTVDYDYSRMRDITYSSDGNTQIRTDIFTRAWKVSWTFYGPDGVDQARAVRSGLDTVPFVEDYLAGFNLYVNPSIKEPERMPENFQGRWWERVDLEARFNEQITETTTVGTVGSVEIKTYTKDGQIADFTVTD